MALRYEWLNDERRIICITYDHTFTLDEYHEVNAAVRQEIQAQPHPVDVIVDQRQLRQVPRGTMSTVRSQMRRNPARVAVIVGMPPIARAIESVLLRVPTLARLAPLTADTIEEAVALIEAHAAESSA